MVETFCVSLAERGERFSGVRVFHGEGAQAHAQAFACCRGAFTQPDDAERVSGELRHLGCDVVIPAKGEFGPGDWQLWLPVVRWASANGHLRLVQKYQQGGFDVSACQITMTGGGE